MNAEAAMRLEVVRKKLNFASLPGECYRRIRNAFSAYKRCGPTSAHAGSLPHREGQT